MKNNINIIKLIVKSKTSFNSKSVTALICTLKSVILDDLEDHFFCL